MMAGWLARTMPLLAALCVGTLACPVNSPAAAPLEIVTVILSQPDVAPGREQIVQVTLRNNGGSAVLVGVRLTVRDERGRGVGQPVQRPVSINPYDEQRVLFTLRAPVNAGAYKVQIGLFSPDFKKRLGAEEPAFYSTFTVGGVGETVAAPAPAPAPAPAAAVLEAVPSFPPPTGLSFELPDVMWENFDITPLSFLIGDQGRIRADLRNIGGDIMRDVNVKVQYFNTRIPNRVEPIAESNVVALAPGEKIEMEWEFAFPEESLLGEYRVVLEARAGAGIRESNTENNRTVSERSIQLNNIRLVFPDPGYIFDEAGLFLFRWESKLYDEFKVQVGVDSSFQAADRHFDIPQGEKWSKDQEVVPLEGELPGMARGLMEHEKSDVVYWRVVGRSTKTSRVGYSRPQGFTIRAEPAATSPAPGELPAPTELRPAGPTPPAAPAQPAQPSGARPIAPEYEPPLEPEAPNAPGGAGTTPPSTPSTPQAATPSTPPPAAAPAAPAVPQTR